MRGGAKPRLPQSIFSSRGDEILRSRQVINGVGACAAVGGSIGDGGISGKQEVVASAGGVLGEAAVGVLRRLFLHGADQERN